MVLLLLYVVFFIYLFSCSLLVSGLCCASPAVFTVTVFLGSILFVCNLHSFRVIVYVFIAIYIDEFCEVY